MKTMMYLQDKWQGLLRRAFQKTALTTEDQQQAKRASKEEEPILFI